MKLNTEELDSLIRTVVQDELRREGLGKYQSQQRYFTGDEQLRAFVHTEMAKYFTPVRELIEPTKNIVAQLGALRGRLEALVDHLKLHIHLRKEHYEVDPVRTGPTEESAK